MATPGTKISLPIAALKNQLTFVNNTIFTIVNNDYFEAGVSNTYYTGASWTSRYIGVRSDSQIYVGANALR